MRLLFVKKQSQASVHSPELQQIVSLCVTQARKVFSSCEVLIDPGERDELIRANVDCIMVIDSTPTVLTAGSLHSMKAAVQAGADVVLPSPLNQFVDPTQSTPFYTLRGYERIEQGILADGRPPGKLRTSHLPIALLKGSVLKRVLKRFGLQALFADTALLEKILASVAVAHSGVFYEHTDYYGHVREDIMAHLKMGIGEVLEIGCGLGNTGREIQERYGCSVTGIEKNPQIAKQAFRVLDRVIVGDVEQIDPGAGFDAVVAADLLEHLVAPETFLKRLKTWLRPGGRAILSIPNVGHYSIVQDLLAGRWDYIPAGLLCYTHLRFFTRRTIQDLAGTAGFRQIEIIAQKTEVPEALIGLSQSLDLNMDSLGTSGFIVLLEP